MTTRTASRDRNEAADRSPSRHRARLPRSATAGGRGGRLGVPRRAGRSRSSDADSLGLFLRDLDHHPLPDHDAADRAGQAGGGRRRRGPPRDGRGQPPPGRPLGPALPGPRRRPPRPHPGGHVRPDAGRRQVRLGARLPLLHLRHLVDPPGPAAGRPAARRHHPAADGGGRAQPAGRRGPVGADATSSSGRPPTRRWTTPPTPPPRSARTCPRWPGWWPASTSRPPPTRPPPLGDLVSTDLSDFEDDVSLGAHPRPGAPGGRPARPTSSAQVIRHRFGFDGERPGLAADHGGAARASGCARCARPRPRRSSSWPTAEMLEAAHEAA